MPPVTKEAGLILSTVAGPTSLVIPIHSPEPVTFGRYPGHAVHLNHRLVSRNHAILRVDHTFQSSVGSRSRWVLADLGSAHGVRLNGTKLSAERVYAVEPGDLITIDPWTFRLTDAGCAIDESIFPTRDDNVGTPSICSMEKTWASDLPQKLLALLLECTDLIHQASDEASLATVVLDAAMAGTGYSNGAWIRSMGMDGQADLLAYRGAICDDSGAPRLSRSLIRRAMQGEAVYFSSSDETAGKLQSIAGLGIDEALCLPISHSSTTMGFVYLDSRDRGRVDHNTTREAEGFVLALARLAAVAMSNLLRLDLEKRHLRITTELEAAAKVQQLILPARSGSYGRFSHAGESVTGLHMGGDFFDVIPLSENRLAITIGDVCGKGVAASFIMAVSQGFLHHALRESADPQLAVSALNTFLVSRLEPGKFVSLWVGVLDGIEGKLKYVDAGHGYAFLLEQDREAHRLTTEATLLVGICPECRYEPGILDLPDTGSIALLSDGLVEQPRRDNDLRPQTASVASRERLGVDAVVALLREPQPHEDQIATVFGMVREYAGQYELDDDATALIVEW